MMKYLSNIFILLTLLSCHLFSSDLSINDIRREYKQIHEALPSFKQVKLEIDGYSTDGGDVVGYIDRNKQIRQISVMLYGESGKLYEEYYYLNGALFFVLSEDHIYNVPYYVTPEIAKNAGMAAFDPAKTKIYENRYYFSDGKMVRWLNRDKKNQDKTSREFTENEKTVKDFSDMIYKLVKKNIRAEIISQSEALDLLIHKIEQDALYSAWTKNECLLFSTEETTKKYFQFAISEKHEGSCPGDPSTQPIIDRFQVNRATKEILWYDMTQDKYIDYKYLFEQKKR